MRRRLWLLSLGVLGWMCLWAQPATHNIVSGEYFWDTDPGQGNGTAVSAADALFDEKIEAIVANAAGIPAAQGPHVFKLRVLDANGAWSPVFSMIVHNGQNTTAIRSTQVVLAEYFWDNDPGQGNGSPLVAFDGNLNEAVETLIGSGLAVPATVDAHTFNVRLQEIDNQWSPVFSTTLYAEASGAVLRPLHVAQAEYFWDTDPGVGNGSTLLALDGGLDEAVEELMANGIGFPAALGGHTLGVRVKDADNQWSDVFSTQVYRGQNTSTLRSAGVMVAEYFWDTDPGAGSGTPMLALDGNLAEVVEALLKNGVAFPAAYGGHTFNVRVQDAVGQWAPVFSTTIYRDSLNGVTRPSQISQAEYFWNTDPGLGAGVPILAVDGSLNEEVEELLQNGVGFPVLNGPHTFNLRVMDADNQWSPIFSTTVYNDSLNHSTRDIRIVQAEYFWDNDPGQGGGTSVLAVDGNLNEAIEALTSAISTSTMSGGPHRLNLRVLDGAGAWSPIFTTLVYVQGGFFPVDSIFGPLEFCGTVPATMQTYSVDTTGIGSNTFTWDATNGIVTNGQGSRQATILWTSGQANYAIQCVTCRFGLCDTITETVIVHPLPIASAGADAAICIGASTQLNGSGGGTYAWSPSTGLSSTSIANPLANPTASTAYILLVTDANGCQDRDTMQLTVNPLPLANAGPDTTICVGGSASLTATGGIGYVWSPTTGLSSPNSASTTASPAITTTYTVTVTDANGCVSTDQVTVTIDNGPTVNAGPDAAICSGGSTQLNASAGHTTYTWTPAAGLSSTSIQNPLAFPAVTTTYTLNATNARGCVGTDQVTVTVNPLPSVSAGADATVCAGLSTTLAATGAASYVWSPSVGLSNPNIANPVATPSATTTYTVTGTDANACQNTDQVVVTVNPLPVANAGTDATICAGDSTQLSGTGGGSYFWQPASGLSNINIANPWAEPSATTDYRLRVTDANGCIDNDTVRVVVTNCTAGLGRAILQAEYYWDTDPGLGNGFAMLAADGNLNEPVEAILQGNINMPAAAGPHVLYVRAKDFRNFWSPVFRRVVSAASPTAAARNVQVVQAEYFWNTDPGAGNGTPLLAVDGNFNEALESVYENGINLPVTTGPHTFNVRVRDVAGLWSQTFRTTVQRLPRTGFNRTLAVTQAEYYWDADPGQGSGTPLLAFDGNLDEMVEGLLENAIAMPAAAGSHVFHVRVKDFDNQWSTAFRTVVNSRAQATTTRSLNVTAAEYFWDTDPGQGAATPMLIVDGNLDEAIEALYTNGVPVPTTVGNHSFNVRVQDADNAWGPLFKTIVYQGNNQAGLRDVKIVQAEYFWDTDPGFGNGTAMLATDGNLGEAVEAVLANGISLPAAAGPHSFWVRVKDVDNQWSDVFQTTVVRGNNTVGTRPMELVQAEYYWDADPGIGNGTPMLAVDGSLNEITEALFRNTISMPAAQGAHTFSVRVRDVSGTWSDPFSTLVVRGSNTVGTRPMAVTQAEYFWNSDPGAGNGTALLAVDGTLNEIVEALFKNTLAMPVPQGNHVFNVRVRDISGTWSDVFRTMVVRDSVTVGNRDMRLVQAEYYWNADPGQGNGTPVLASDGALNEMVEALLRSNISMPSGNVAHKFSVRVKDVDNAWSDPFSTVVVRGIIQPNARQVYVAQGEYYWDTDPGAGNGTPVFAVDGNYNEAVENLFRSINVLPLTDQHHILGVRVKDVTNLWSPVFRRVVYINLPDVFVQDSITGDFDFCSSPQGPNQPYSVTSVPNVAYNWTVTGGSIAAGQGTNAIQVAWGASGPYYVQLVGCVNTVCDTLRDTLDVTPSINPNAGPNDTICQGQTVQLTASGGVSYLWSPAAGLNNRFLQNPLAQPSVTTTYTVLVTDANGCQGSGSVTITVQPPPTANAGPDQSTCLGQSVQLQGSGGVSYAWQPAAFLSNPNIANPIASPIVTTTFVLTVTDANGCTGTDEMIVTVGDAPPTISCPANAVVGNDLGLCSAIVTYTAPVGMDNCPGATTAQIAGLGSGAIFPVGTTTETYRVTDTQGNTATCSFTVTVQDQEAPVLACMADISVLTLPNQCGYTLNYTLPSASDNCPGVTVTRVSGPASGTFLAPGQHLIRFRALDVAGIADSCTWTVTVIDNQAPVITCPASISLNASAGLCAANASFAAPTATDNCSGTTVQRISGLASGSSFPVGITLQTYVATDAGGNTDTCSFTVTVIDNQLPAITCPANISVNTDPGQCAAIVTYSTPVGTDNCAGASTALTAGLASGSSFPGGTTTVTYTVTDPSGNTRDCSFDVAVLDLQAPVIVCPANIIQQNDPDSCGATISYAAPAATDNCPNLNVVLQSGLASGVHFPVGNTNITYRATDVGGNVSTCTFSVNIVDSTYPVVICPPDTTIYTNPAICANIYNYVITAYDNCPRDSLVRTSGLPSGASFPLGTTITNFKLIDASGNTDSCAFSVTVIDGVSPSITCPANVVTNTSPSACGAIVNYITPTGTDNCTGSTTTRIAGLASGSLFPIGTTLVAYRVEDGQGQADTCSFTVTVNDNVLPGITCPSNITVASTPGSMPCSGIATYAAPNYADNCPGASLAQTAGLPSGSAFPQGITTNTFVVTDAVGNTATCSFTVEVGVCNQDPIAVCQNITVGTDANCQGNSLASAFDGGSSDPDGHSLTFSTSPAGPYALGTTTVTLTVSDPYGGSDQCTATITVIDNTPPSITCPANISVSNDPGNCGAVVNYVAPTGNDNCGAAITNITAGQVSGTNFVVGTTTNTYTVGDGAGNTSSCSFTVTVHDNEMPTITCPSTIIRTNDPGICGALVTYVQPFANDNCSGETVTLTSGLSSGSTFPVGSSTVTYRVRDAVGHDVFCNFNVIVTDTELPSIVCPANITQNSDAGGCGTTVHYTTPVGTDNCAGANTVLSAGFASGAQFPGGSTQVIYTVLDNAGNQANCSFSVAVIDNQQPSINCPASIVQNNDLNVCGALVNYNTPSGTDNCSSASTVQTTGLASGSVFPIGTTVNTFVVTDTAGNGDTCAFAVTVNDVQNPTITCPSNLYYNVSASTCDTLVVYNAPVGTDNCPSAVTVRTAGLASGSNFPVGVTTQSFTVTDAAGNTASCSFQVTVIDNVLPQITCPSNMTVSTDPGTCAAIVSFVEPVGTDNCAGATTARTQGLAPGSSFPKGTTTQTYVVTDQFGNDRTCSFTITVQDNELPVIACPANITVTSAAGGCGQNVGYTPPVGSDNCPFASTSRTSGLAPNAFFPVGVSSITYTVTDAAGNSDNCSFTVTVQDNQLPSIACPANIAVNNDPNVCGALVVYTAPIGTDNCSAATTTRDAGLGSGAVFPVGTTTESYTVTDSSGNTSTCSFTVTVQDAQNPVVLCPNDIYINADPGQCSAIANYTPPVGTDNCLGATTTQIQGLSAGASFPIGTTIEIFRVTDAVGRTDTCHLRISIIDNQLPSIVCPANLSVGNDPGACGATVNYATPVGTDNCAGAGTTQIQGFGSGTFFGLGTHQQTFRVTDAYGNQATCSFDITVSDAEAPQIACPANIVAFSTAGGCGADVHYATPVGTDNCLAASTQQVAGLGSGAIFPVGITTETYTVTDAGGRTHSCSFTINVQDNTKPTISCPASIVQVNDLNACGAVVSYTTPIGLDNCSNASTLQTAGLPSTSVFPIGSTLNTFVVTDSSGNTDSCSFTVTINDVQAPTILCPANITVNIAPGTCAQTVSYLAPIGHDNCPGAVTVQSQGQPSGSSFGAGTNVQTFVSTDVLGNVDSCSFAIFVIDNELPQIACPANISVPTDAGQCSAVVVYNTPVGTDNCPNPATLRIAGLASGATFPLGSTVQGFRVTDIYGNVATCSFTVTVIDSASPSIVCQANPTVNAQAGGCGAIVNYIVPVGTDNCPFAGTVLSAGLGAGAFFPAGMTTETYTVTDAAGNTASCSIVVTVLDNQNPSIACPANISVWNDPGQCGAVVSYIVPAGVDNCAGASTTQTGGLGTGALFPVGVTGETYTAVDSSGNTATCSFSITVIDHENPSITCPQDTTVVTAAGQCMAIVNYITPAGTDNCPGAVTTLTHGLASGSAFSLGNTLIRYRVTDVYNRIDSCQFVVSVVDGQVPGITCPANISVSNDPGVCGASINYPLPVATDNCPGLNLSLQNGLPSGATFPIGTTTVTYRATDAGGNSTDCAFSVTVNDTELPVIICQAPITLNSDLGGCGTHVSYTVPVGTDNCPFPSTQRIAGLGSGAFFPVGTTLSVYQVTDAHGNSSTCTVSVTILDNEDPAITCPANIVANNSTGLCGTVVNYTAPIGTDNCSGASTIQNRGIGSGGFFPVGTTAENFVVTDSAGNVDSCSFTVTVIDNERPALACPADITQPADAGQCGAIVNYATPNGIDNCVGDTSYLSQGLPSGAFFPLGATLVRYIAEDAHGNIDSCDFVVNILDAQPPVVSCPSNIVLNNEPGICGAAFTYTTPIGTDNCAGVSTVQTAGLPSASIFPVGITTNTFVAMDVVGQTAACSFTVTVDDVERPTIVCPADPVVFSQVDTCGAYVSYVPPVGNDNCAGTTALMAGLGNGNFFPVGLTTEIYVVTDPAGLRDTCSLVVHVIDNQAPGLVCPANIVRSNDAGLCGAVVNYNVPIGVDNCSGTSTMLSTGLPSGSLFPVGITTVQFTATDTTGNAVSCTFTVTVDDNEAPSVNCPANISVNNDPGQCSAAVSFAATATDNCTGASIVYSHASGSAFAIGNTLVTATATDTGGNTSACSFNVVVNDAELPTIACPADVVVSGTAGSIPCTGIATYASPSYSDNCTGAVLTQTAGFVSGAAFPQGTTTNAFLVTDASGNTAACSFTVEVGPCNRPPVAVCQNITLNADASCAATAPANAFDGGSSDPDGDALSFSVSPAGPYALGTTAVTLTVSDPYGMSDQCAATVTVIDNTAPVTICPANITVGNDPGLCGAAVSFSATATDNCVGASIVYSHASGSTFAIGNTTVTATATDSAGNTHACSFDVTVSDTEAPVATCPANITVGNDPGLCGAAVSFSATATDNCAGVSVAYSHASGSVFAIGNTTVTATATDSAGNTHACSFTVSVSDGEAPVAKCQNLIVSLDASGQGTITASLVNNGSTDNCGIASISIDSAQFSCQNIEPDALGLFISEYIEGNANNKCIEIFNGTGENLNLAGYQLRIYANGGSTPSSIPLTGTILNGDVFVICHILANASMLANADYITGALAYNGDDAVVLTNNGVPVDVIGRIGEDPGVAWVAGANSTLDRTLVRGRDVNIGNTANVSGFPSLANEWISHPVDYAGNLGSHIYGATTVSMIVTDIHGNADSCEASVTVRDQMAPTAVCQNISLQLDVNGQASITGIDLASGSTDNCGIDTILLNRTSFTCSDAYNPISELFISEYIEGGANNKCVEIYNGTGAAVNLSNYQLRFFFNGVLTSGNTINLSGTLASGDVWVVCDDNSAASFLAQADQVNTGFFYTGNDAVALYKNGVSIDAVGRVGEDPGTAWTGNGKSTMNQTLVRNANVMAGNTSSTIGWPSIVTEWTGYPQDYVANLGSHTVMASSNPVVLATVVDESGNVSTCTAIVTVLDTTAPSIVCPANISVGNDAGQCGAAINFAASVTDNCSGVSVSYSHAPGAAFGLGATTVTATGTDNGGNTDVCSFTITVTDTEAPVATCPANITVGNDPGLCEAAVSFSATASDNCAGASIAYSHASGSAFAIGITTVTATATDAAGNTAACSFAITVTDTEAPVATCPANITVGNDPGLCEAAASFSATATDNCTGASIAYSHASGSTFAIGNTTVTATATDAAGNTAACSFEVIVNDVELPAITCPANMSVPGTAGSQPCSAVVTYSAATFSDNCAGASLSQTSGFVSGAAFPQGITTNTFVATDASGNAATCSFTVEVGPCNRPPVAVCQSITLNADASCQATASAAAFDGGSSDPDGDALTLSVSPAGPYALGTTSVTLTVSDPFGLAAQCSATVTVIDITAPVITACPSDQALTAGTSCVAVANWVAPTASDNCGTAVLSSNHAPGSSFGLGTTLVTYTATDGSGNASICSFNITVQSAAFTAAASATTNFGGFNVSCNGGSNAAATVTASGGCTPYTYQWSNGASTASITGLSAGIYTVTVSSAGAGTATASVTITEPTALAATGVVTNTGCGTANNGAIDLTVSGGTAPYTYLWSPGGATTQDLSGLGAGTYTVSITDANGCTRSNGFTVLQNSSSLVANAGPDRSVVYDSGPGADPYPCAPLAGSATGGNAPYIYAWAPTTAMTGSNTATPTVCPTVTTTYTLTVTDATGCTATDQVLVTAYDQASGNLPYVGNNHNKVYVCQNGVTRQVNVNAPCNSPASLCNALNNGATLGPCPAKAIEGSSAQAGDAEGELEGIIEAMPNPFTDGTTIRFSLNTDDQARLRVYSLTGVMVADLFDGELKAGMPVEVKFDGNGVADGIYFARLESRSGAMFTVKLVLQR